VSDLLNYQPSRSAVYYTPPERLDVRRTVWAFVLAAALASAGAFAYARLQPRLTSPYLRVGAVAAAATAVAGLALIPVRVGRVRVPGLAAAIGALLALLTLYVMWLVWVHDVLALLHFVVSYRALIVHPRVLMHLIRSINSFGTWSYGNETVRGLPLTLCWLIEAGAILAAGVLAPIRGLFSDDPTCVHCAARCVRVRDLPRFAADRQAELLASVENRDFAALASHAAPHHEDAPELSLRLMSCPRCGRTHVLTVSRIAWQTDRHGRAKVQTTPLINQVLITPAEAEEMKIACEQVQAKRAQERASAET